MTIEKSHPSNLEKRHEGEKPTDTVLGKNVIHSSQQNEQSNRLKVLDAIKSFKLTADGQQSFTLDFGDGSSIKDSRVSRQLSNNQNELVASDAKTGPEPRSTEHGIRQLATARDVGNSRGERIPEDHQDWKEGRSDFPDYSRKDVRTKAPEDVVVIGAEGIPGQLFAVKDGKEITLELSVISTQIGDIQKEKSENSNTPRLVYIQACQSGEDAVGGSTAAQIAKSTHSYVVGNLGFGDSVYADTTRPPLRIPGTDIIIPNPSGVYDKVRLFNPDGKPIGDFQTPIDWKAVKKAEQDDYVKHKH